MASNTLTTQEDDLEDEMLEVITSGNHATSPTSGGVPQAVTVVGTQNIFTGPTPAGTVGEATLDLQISDAEEVFVEANAFRTAKRNLEELGHVTICGASGEGKTTTALMLGSQYRRNGYKLAFVDRIDQFDLDSFLSSSPRVFLIIDDMFGSVGLSTDVSQLKLFLSKLLPHLQRCKKDLRKQHSLRNHPAKKRGEKEASGVSDPAQKPSKDIRVVFTSKTYNFHDGLAQMQYEGFSLFKGQTVVDITKQTKQRYTQEEKKAIFEKHRNLHKKCSHEGNENDKDFEDMVQCAPWDVDSVFGFPLTCKLFFEFSSFSKHMMNFFKEPLLYLRLELKSLLGSKTDRSAILVLMLLCEEKLDLAKLESAGKDEALDNMIRTVLELFPKASRAGIYEAAKGFRGTFFTSGDTVGFAHSSIYDACACALYDISPTFVLTHCSDNFIYERVQPRPVSETEIDEHLHVIYISESYYDILTTRLAKSIKDGHFSKSVTHPILRQDKIVLQLLEKLQPDESMEESWFHKRDMGRSILYWTVLGHSSKFAKGIEKETGEKFTQIEITESFEGCVFKNNVTLLKWLFSRCEHPVVGITLHRLLLLSAVHGSSETLLYLLREGGDTVTTAGNYKTIIHKACRTGQQKILNVLQEHNSDLFKTVVMNSVDDEGMTPLMEAANAGSNDCYQILKSISNKNIKDKSGNAVVHYASLGGNIVIVQDIVSSSNINTRGSYGRTPVMTAASKGHKSVFDLLVSKKADLTLLDNHGNSLLHHACIGGNTAIVQHVVSPSNVNSRGQNGRTPVMEAACKGHKSVFDLLVSEKADLTLLDDRGDSLLHLACAGGNTAIVQHVVSPSIVNTRGRVGRTPVMEAACKGHQSVFDLLVSKKADLTLLDDHGDSLLHLACAGGNTAIVQHVVSESNINSRGQDRRTPVMEAACKGHKSVFDLLVSEKADLTLLDDRSDSLLHLACAGGNTAIVQHVVSESNINSRGQDGRTPVMEAACKGHQSVFDFLVSKKADLTLLDGNGYSFLHFACAGGNTAIVQHVVSESNINSRGQDGRTPVMTAAGEGQQSVFDFLVSEKADLTLLDDDGNSLPHIACIGGNTAIVQHVVSSSNINTRGHHGRTPVMTAAVEGQQSVFDFLVSKKADLTLRDDHGNSLLHLACAGGNTAIVQHVVSESNINSRGQDGRTPVMTAAGEGQQSVFDFLVSKKADLTLRDDHGNSLLHLACAGGNTAIVQHLLSHSNINVGGHRGWTPVVFAALRGHQRVFDLLVSRNADLTQWISFVIGRFVLPIVRSRQQ
ncbi:serine/threonine-protein phosphatase 6 regulatory ankyrin repeat subunit B-like [Haliotis cracherodii]|uniref:serine/threonine-protein phosphatase 6 regulatory ankyrin repeat subunit B-like n=1 Tax=Haliotis cracherodii TaxID=6455 RepID=UPI0039E877BD